MGFCHKQPCTPHPSLPFPSKKTFICLFGNSRKPSFENKSFFMNKFYKRVTSPPRPTGVLWKPIFYRFFTAFCKRKIKWWLPLGYRRQYCYFWKSCNWVRTPPPSRLPKSKLFPGAPLDLIKVSFIFPLKLWLFVCCTAYIVLWSYSNLFTEK